MIHNINIKNLIYFIVIDKNVIPFAYPELFSPLAIAENWNI